jgi:transmembrane sensor
MISAPERMTDAKTIEAQAVEWLIARDEHQTWTDENQRQFDAWLARSPAHLTAFWRVEASWNRTELMADIRPFGFGANRPDQRGFSWLTLLRVAASLSFFAILGIGASFYFAGSEPDTFATPIGGHKIITLFDGSQIELNTDTVLQIGRNQRGVTLVKGEAFFQIHHDAAHPFTVAAAGHVVTDLGTKFLIRENGKKLEVALVEGRARLESDDATHRQAATLVPGDVAFATAGYLAVGKKTAQELQNELAWRKGILVFDDTPLTAAAAEFNRYNNVKVVVSDRNAGRLEINGSIHANDGAEFARLAKNLFGLRTEERGNEIFIGR